MSISTTATKVSYAGNNSNSTPYAITFKYLDVSHVTVYADKVDITTNCTFSGDGAAGTGQFTTDAAQAPTVTVAAVLDVPLDQPVVLQETGSLPAKTLEVSGFDRLNMQIRRVWRGVQDTLRFSSDEGSGSTGTADTLVGFDSSGDIAEIPNTTFCQTANNLSDVTAATARTNLGVDAAGTDNSTDVTLAGTGTYISIAGQVITVDPITESDISDLGAYITDITGENLTDLSDVTIATPSTGQVLSWNGSAWVNTAAGNGDMLAATYDPTSVAGDAFNMDNMVAGTTNKLFTATDETKLDSMGTTQGVGATTYNIQASDEGTVAGNARGDNSVDLQTTRTAATEVASGDYSALVAGQNNTASGAGSFCGGGLDNSASNTRAVVMGGNGNTASGSASIVLGGIGCTASGAETLVAGENATASHNGARLFANNFATAFPSIATQEFAIQASALRLVDDNEGAGKVLTCDANGSGNWAAPAKVVYTVATLPATPAQGDVAMVTDASAPTFLSTVASGGSVVTPVFYNGTAWIVG